MQLLPATSCASAFGASHGPQQLRGGLPSLPVHRRRVSVRAQEPFNEGAEQVRRLVKRDRKEFVGNKVDILDQYATEFGDVAPRKNPQIEEAAKPAAASTSQPAASQPSTSKSPSSPAANPFKTTSSDNPFGGDNPFGSPSNISPFGNSGKTKSRIEPEGLRPDMGPDAIVKETPFDIFKDITLTQVVLFFSFTLIIALMIGTFYLVLNTGAINLKGV